MYYCKQCGKYFIPKIKIYAGDINVCSNECAKNRIKDILNIDNNLQNPNLWDFLLTEKKTFHICEYCHIKINKSIDFYKLNNFIYYCSYKCKKKHWLNGYNTTLWRNGKVHPTKLNKTPSIINYLNNLS